MASSDSDAFELNLTPLLDMVLQLIMFFMMCVNFVSQQVNANVLLPTSSSAQEIQPKSEGAVVVVNIEIVREEKRDASGKPVFDKEGKPEREVKLDANGRMTSRILIFGYNPIEFTIEREGAALGEAQRLLAKEARIYRQREATRQKKKADDVELSIPVIIRADAETRYGLVVLLMAQCVKEGFSKVELRAMTKVN
jgi:biopolymer transport protein ExbD